MPDFRPAQRFAFDWLQSRPRAILALEQRMGKTGVAARDIADPCNIVCPAYLKRDWLEAIQLWRPDLQPRLIEGAKRPAPGGNVWISNYDILQDCYLVGAPELIVDEGHYCKSHEAKRALTVLALAEQATKVRWLTGTVMPSRSMELWPVMRAMRATRMDANSFGVHFAGGYQDQWNGWHYPKDTNSAELRAALDPFILRLTRAQVGMPPNEWKVISLDLPIDERERAYDLASIARNPTPIAFEGLADLLKFQGLSKVPQALAYLKDLLIEKEGPLLVFAWHKEVIAELARAMTAGGYRVLCITGDTPFDERKAFVAHFQVGECDVLIGNTMAAGTGFGLHTAERVVFVEGRWTPAEMNQAADRGVSMDRPRSLRVDVLTVHRSIDEFMVRRCLEKQRAIDTIIQPNAEFSTWQEKETNPQRHRLKTLLRRPFA